MALKVVNTLWRGEQKFSGAWQLSNGVIRMVVSQLGGHIACISDDVDGALNPMWQPHWEAKDPSKIPYDGTASLSRGWVMSKKFGGGSEAALLAGIVGHNLCIDRFGPPRNVMVQQGKLMKEKQEDRPMHGEAGVLPWDKIDQTDDTVRFGVKLPTAQLSVERTFSFDDRKILMQTEVRPLDGAEKNIEWCEHVTIGDPFLDGATVEANVDAAWHFSEPCPESRFPDVPPVGSVPIDAALAIPTSSDPPCGDVVAARAVDGQFAVSNLGKTLTYKWDKAVFPWLCLWTEHKSRADVPWDGVERTRGFEFSSKPFPEVMVEERLHSFEGTPTTCTVPPEGLTTSVEIEWK